MDVQIIKDHKVVYFDTKDETILYETTGEEHIKEIKLDNEPRLMSYEEIKEVVKGLVEKFITNK